MHVKYMPMIFGSVIYNSTNITLIEHTSNALFFRVYIGRLIIALSTQKKNVQTINNKRGETYATCE